MGWARMLLLGNVGQQLDIHDISRTLDRLYTIKAEHDRSQDRELAALREENLRLRAAFALLVRQLGDRSLLSDADRAALADVLDPVDTSPPGDDPLLDLERAVREVRAPSPAR